MSVHELPIVNAILNGASAGLLATAYLCIRAKKVKAHATVMLAALTSSAAFLTCYLIYHFNVHEKSSGLPAGLFKTTYLIMLLTHVLLAVGMLPLIAIALWRAYTRQFHRHMKIARPTFWIWLYVSVTGVVIYFVLYHIAPAMYPTKA